MDEAEAAQDAETAEELEAHRSAVRAWLDEVAMIERVETVRPYAWVEQLDFEKVIAFMQEHRAAGNAVMKVSELKVLL